MKAVVLVGGEGTRLRPLTYHAPKQMLPIVGVPMLERVLENLKRHGVTEVILSLGYLPDRFVEAYPDFVVGGLPVSYAVEPEPLDTAGAIRFAALHGGVEETFVVVNGDVLTDLDLTELVATHRARGAETTIALHPVEDPSRYGVVVTDAEGRVLSFVEKPPAGDAPSNEINAGTYVMEPSVIDLITPDVKVSVERVTFPELVALGTLFAQVDSGYWLDTGTPQAYLQAHSDILSGHRSATVEGGLAGGNWVHPTATVDSTARLAGTSVDRGASVGAGAVVEDTVLMPGAVVGPGARVTGCILGPHARVGTDARLGPTCVIGAGEHITDGARLEGDVRVGGPS